MKPTTKYVFVVPESAVTDERDRVFWARGAKESMRSVLRPNERAVGDVVFDLWEVPVAFGGSRALRWTWTIEVKHEEGLAIDQVEFSSEGLARVGFQGFRTFAELRTGALAEVPSTGGVYVVIRESQESVEFLTRSPGGWPQGRDPTVDPAILKRRWVPLAPVVYIGEGHVLREWLREFADFGTGEPVGHLDGRCIWQIKDSESLTVAWMETQSEKPCSVEGRLLTQFRDTFGAFPFANIA